MSTRMTVFTIGPQRPQMDIRGLNTDTEAFGARVYTTLKKAGRTEQAATVMPILEAAKSHGEAMAQFMTLVDFVYGEPKRAPIPTVHDAQLLAGTYIVSDPSAVFDNTTYTALQTHGDWSGRTPSLVNGLVCWILPAKLGQGLYEGDTSVPDWNPERFYTESGYIAIIQLNEASIATFLPQWVYAIDGVLNIQHPFMCVCDSEDVLLFGDFLSIPTRTTICTHCGDRYCDGTCEDEE